MKELELTQEIKIDKDDLEIDVELDFRCHIDKHLALYPMTVSSSIYKGYSLQDFIKESRENYENENYMKVQLVKIRIDLPDGI